MIWEGSQLYHHGIKGQKWGVRNGPPYPLKKMHGEQESNVASSVSNEIAANKAKHPNKSLDDAPKKNEVHSRDEDMAIVNHSQSDRTGRNGNCVMCSAAMEARIRGYDVFANSSLVGRNFEEVMKWFDMEETDLIEIDDDPKTYYKTSLELDSFPKGARGFIGADCAKKPGGKSTAHNMFWEKEDDHVIIRDVQNNKKYDTVLKSPIGYGKGEYIVILRVDDKTINAYEIMDAVDYLEGENDEQLRNQEKAKKRESV